MRTCHWCGKPYDPEKGSSIWCEKNPRRGLGASRRKPRIISIGVMALEPNPWAQSSSPTTL